MLGRTPAENEVEELVEGKQSCEHTAMDLLVFGPDVRHRSVKLRNILSGAGCDEHLVQLEHTGSMYSVTIRKSTQLLKVLISYRSQVHLIFFIYTN